MNKYIIAAVAITVALSVTGCGVKGWVHQRTAPATPAVVAPTVVAPATTTETADAATAK